MPIDSNISDIYYVRNNARVRVNPGKFSYVPNQKNHLQSDTLHLKHKHLVFALFIIISIALVILLFKPLLTLFFINDDLTILYGARKTLDISYSKISYLITILTSPSTFDMAFRPISVMLYPAILFKMFALNPIGYHCVNLFLHILNTVLFFFLINTIFKDRITSCLSALLYGIRDYHYINLAYAVAGSADLLVQAAIISTLLFYFKYLREKRPIDLIFVYLFYILSFLCKEIAVILFGLLLLLFCYQHWVVLKKQIGSKKMHHLIFPFVVTCLFVVWRLHLQQSVDIPSRLQIDRLIPFRFFMNFAYSFLGYHYVLPFKSKLQYANVLELYIGIIIFFFCIASLINRPIRNKMVLALIWFSIAISPMLLQPGRHAVHYAIIPSYILIGVIVSHSTNVFRKTGVLFKSMIVLALLLYIFLNWQIIQLKYNDRIWTGGYIRTFDSKRLAAMINDIKRIVPESGQNTNIFIANYYSDVYISANPGGEEYKLHFIGEHLLKLFYYNQRMEVHYFHPGKPMSTIPVSWFTDFQEFIASYDTRKDVLLLYMNGHFYDYSKKEEEVREIALNSWRRHIHR